MGELYIWPKGKHSVNYVHEGCPGVRTKYNTLINLKVHMYILCLLSFDALVD